MTDILGLNAYHADSAAVLLRDGALLAGIEEERLNRIKHWAGFPERSVAAVLEMGAIGLENVEHVAVSRDPRARIWSKLRFVAGRRPRLGTVWSRLLNMRRVGGIEARLLGMAPGGFRGRIHAVEHHRAHLASAFFCSPFERAACLTVDGSGDFVSSMSALGQGNRLEVLDEVRFPHSLGVLYTAVTQFLGFTRYGDEYKVMGLASFGEPRLCAGHERIEQERGGRPIRRHHREHLVAAGPGHRTILRGPDPRLQAVLRGGRLQYLAQGHPTPAASRIARRSST